MIVWRRVTVFCLGYLPPPLHGATIFPPPPHTQVNYVIWYKSLKLPQMEIKMGYKGDCVFILTYEFH